MIYKNNFNISNGFEYSVVYLLDVQINSLSLCAVLIKINS